jgi:hypothetical protein
VPRELRAVLDLPVPVEAAYAVLASGRWPEALAAGLGDDARVESVSRDREFRMVHSHRLPAGAPGWVSTVLPKDGRVVQTDTWALAAGPDGSRSGTWAVSFPGAPGEAAGTSVLSADPGGGCTWTVIGTVALSIPLIGGKVEGYVVTQLENLLEQQADVLTDAAS